MGREGKERRQLKKVQIKSAFRNFGIWRNFLPILHILYLVFEYENGNINSFFFF